MIAYRGMFGLGDSICQRAFLKTITSFHGIEVLLETPWPEIYKDLPNLQFQKPNTRLRTQKKNAEKVSSQVWAKPYFGQAIKIGYQDKGIMRGMRDCFKVDPSPLDLPNFESPIKGDYAIIRPATVRKEWMAASRNPKPEYLAECAEILLSRGIRVISIADLQDGEEWALNPLPRATETYHQGEFSVSEILGLVQHAKVVVGGVGWLTPASIAYKVPSWVIFGGFGAYNSPETLFDADSMDLRKLGYAMPDEFCRCRDGRHNCKKDISNHAEKFAEWLGRLPNLEP